MPIESDIKEFKSWAIRLGCPMDYFPENEQLKQLFHSGQSVVFRDIMTKIRSKQEVQYIRDNIAVNKILKFKGNSLTTTSKQLLPVQLQHYLHIQKLKERITETENRINDHKFNYECEMAKVKGNNIKKLHLKNEIEEVDVKCSLLKNKLLEYKTSVESEKEYSKKLQEIYPNKYIPGKISYSEAETSINNCIIELQKFYSCVGDSNVSDKNLNIETTNLWNKIRKTFANIPNMILWKILMNSKDKIYRDFTLVSNLYVSNDSESMSKNQTVFQTELNKAYVKHITLCTDKKSITEERHMILNEYTNSYCDFVKYMELLNINQNIDDNIIEEYVINYNLSVYKQSEIEYLTNEIKNLELEIEQRSYMLEDHPMVIKNIQQIYADIETIYSRMLEEIAYLHKVREKINYTKNLMNYLVKTTKSQYPINNDLIGRQCLDLTVQEINNEIQTNTLMETSAISSFNTTCDSVFCSTKLDADNTMHNKIDKTINNTLTNYVDEITTFLRLPMDKLNHLTLGSSIILKVNYLNKILSCEKLLSKFSSECMSEHLVTIDAAIMNIQNKCKWNKKIHCLAEPLKTDLISMKTNEVLIKNNKNRQTELMSEYMDKIYIINTNIKSTLNDMAIFYKFLINNPFRKYIPKHKLFNGRTYQEYESEFSTYYNIITSFNKN